MPLVTIASSSFMASISAWLFAPLSFSWAVCWALPISSSLPSTRFCLACSAVSNALSSPFSLSISALVSAVCFLVDSTAILPSISARFDKELILSSASFSADWLLISLIWSTVCCACSSLDKRSFSACAIRSSDCFLSNAVRSEACWAEKFFKSSASSFSLCFSSFLVALCVA